MNQIICTSSTNIENNLKTSILNKKSKILLLRIIFCISIVILILMILYYLYFKYASYNLEKLSKDISDNLRIKKLYTTSYNYNANYLNEDIFFHEDTSYSVIGNIKIDKLDISYPILSSISKELLKVAPCRFYGPLPNEVRKCLYCST